MLIMLSRQLQARVYVGIVDDINDDMPYKYRHIRKGKNSVHASYYQVAEILEAQFHMSSRQAEGAVVTVANLLFGCQDFGPWKIYDKKVSSDCHTLPAPTNLNRVEPCMEAMVLAGIVTEIMSPHIETIVTYSNDGSSQSGVGNYIVHSFTINGKQRALPTLSLFTESRKTLKELEIITLEIPSAASGGRFSAAEILKILIL